MGYVVQDSIVAFTKGDQRRIRLLSSPSTPSGCCATRRSMQTHSGTLQLLWCKWQLPQLGATDRSDGAELDQMASPSKQSITSHMEEVRCHIGAIPPSETPHPRADLGWIATSHTSGGAGWWKSPSPDLERALGERSPGATRQSATWDALTGSQT